MEKTEEIPAIPATTLALLTILRMCLNTTPTRAMEPPNNVVSALLRRKE